MCISTHFSDCFLGVAFHDLTFKINVLYEVCHNNGFVLGGEAKAYTHDWESQRDRDSVLDPEGVDTKNHLTILNKAGSLAKECILQLGWTEGNLSPLIKQYGSFADFADALQKVYDFKEDKSDDTSNTRQHTANATLHAEVVEGGAREMIKPVEDSINELIEAAKKSKRKQSPTLLQKSLSMMMQLMKHRFQF